MGSDGMLTLTNRQARALLVRYHNLDGADGFRGLDGARAVMGRLGTIQFDPLNVAGRNPDLVLQARVRGYRPDHLRSLLYEERFLTDGYDKEMCIYTAKDFAAFAPIRAMRSADARRWLEGRGQGEAFDMLDDVLDIIRRRGPSSLSDIPIGESKDFGWGPRRPSGAAIEYLFTSGRLCVSDKAGIQRRFDLAENVLPAAFLAPVEREGDAFADWYVKRRLGCVGLLWDRRGGAWQGYVVGNDATRKAALNRLSERGEIVPCRVEGIRAQFYALPEAVSMLEGAVRRPTVRFIAPLDNLMWDRDMVEALFAFRYRWEVYTPVVKREYGYYVLPVLYGDRFVARFEPENVSKAGCLRVKGWWWEDGVRVSAALLSAVEAALARFSRFLGVESAPGNMDAVRNAAEARR